MWLKQDKIKLRKQNISRNQIKSREALTLKNKIRKMLFRIRWAMMSDNSKIDYLWTRTEEK